MDAENSTETTKPVGRPFRPGVSGNPGGRPKGTSIVAAILRNLSDEDADEIARAWIADAKKGKHRRQVRESLTERVDGKSTQAVEVSGPEGGEITIRMVTNDDLDT